MTLADKLNRAIYGGSPYEGFDAASYPLDLQGWGSNDVQIDQLIDQVKPELIVEIGTWKGASALHMVSRARRYRDAAIICVDTWLGSAEHWIDHRLRPMLNCRHGRPMLYEQFLANVIHSGLQDAVVPMPLTSRLASLVIQKMGLRSSLIYIDGAHDEGSVREDIAAYWPLVAPTGVLFGDDYENQWPGLQRAVQEFFAERRGEFMSNGISGIKWVAQKRAT